MPLESLCAGEAPSALFTNVLPDLVMHGLHMLVQIGRHGRGVVAQVATVIPPLLMYLLHVPFQGAIVGGLVRADVTPVVLWLINITICNLEVPPQSSPRESVSHAS